MNTVVNHKQSTVKALARVVGMRRALRLLRSVENCPTFHEGALHEKDVGGLVIWEETEQGHRFWQVLNERINRIN